jgi:glycosyltransferase involved in cell wall biosynthesis
MTRIGIDARLTFYRTGGISTYIRRLVTTLEKSDSQHDYTIFHIWKDKNRLGKRFTNTILWTPAHHRIERLALSVELARHRLHLFHSPDFIPPYRGAKKHIITVHDLTFLHYPQYLDTASRRYYNDQIQAAVHHADHIFSDSYATKNDLMAMLNVLDNKITVHHLGISEIFHPQSPEKIAAVQTDLDLPPVYFLHVGTLEPRKNILGLLTAYRDLLLQLPDAPPIVLVGKPGWVFEATQAQIARLNIDKHLYWRESVTDDQLPAIYSGAVAVVNPSFYEGFGFPPLEGMACGVVPIVSNRSSLPEVVGDVGIQVNPDDVATITAALYQVLMDSAWRSEMQQKAILQAQRFSWEDCARIVLNVYNSLL